MLRQLQNALFSQTAQKTTAPRQLDFVPAPEAPPAHQPPYIDDDFWQIDEEAVVHPPTGHCFDLTLDTFFNASHFVTMAGTTGPEHEHSYRLRVRCISQGLAPDDQVVVGFRELRVAVQLVAAAYNGRRLNDLPSFQRLQPTTENLAAVLFQQVRRALGEYQLRLTGVTVWESPTESATYRLSR
jgi:6-pyruvoyltetrahydropterin/6-carboxytetrahydropterin synthase